MNEADKSRLLRREKRPNILLELPKVRLCMEHSDLAALAILLL